MGGLPGPPDFYPNFASNGVITSGLGLFNYGQTPSTSPLNPAANFAFYMPLLLSVGVRIKNLWWVNGSATSGTVDIGIYLPSGEKIVTLGAHTAAGTNAKQSVALGSDLILAPGAYYIAFLGNSATGRFLATTGVTATTMRRGGQMEENVGSGTLPAAMTPTAVSHAFFPYIGGDLA